VENPKDEMETFDSFWVAQIPILPVGGCEILRHKDG
jgi:hypothetical protein